MGFPICPGMDGPLVQSFLARVNGGDWSADKCWTWAGHHKESGYGYFYPAKRARIRAHRFAFELYAGRPAKGLVLHKCDNRSCVNPLHLEEGNHAENARQMVERGRSAREGKNWRAKLSWYEVAASILLYRSDEYTIDNLADNFGVSNGCMHKVVFGANWPRIHAQVDRLISDIEGGHLT